MAHAAELVDTAGAAVGHAVQGALVAEGVPPVVVRVDAVLVLVVKPQAGYPGHAGAGNGDDLARRVGRVVHGRDARRRAPVLAPAPARHVVEAVIPVVVVFRLAVDDAAEGAPRVLLPAIQHARIVVTGLPEHVDGPRSRGRSDQFLDFIHADPGRHRRIDVLSGLQGLDGLGTVEPVLGKEAHGVHVGSAERVEGGTGVRDTETVGRRGPLPGVQVAKHDPFHEGMRFEQGDEGLREGARACDSDVEPHVRLLPGLSKCPRGRHGRAVRHRLYRPVHPLPGLSARGPGNQVPGGPTKRRRNSNPRGMAPGRDPISCVPPG